MNTRGGELQEIASPDREDAMMVFRIVISPWLDQIPPLDSRPAFSKNVAWSSVRDEFRHQRPPPRFAVFRTKSAFDTSAEQNDFTPSPPPLLTAVLSMNRMLVSFGEDLR
jgi:hypothetical protein